ncbi:MAG: hypothetical protein ACHP9Z_02365 [Streptosporangiales bacterium]
MKPRVPFGQFAEAWIKERPGLRPKSAELYPYLLRRYLRPSFGNVAIASISEARVRRWRKELICRMTHLC